MGLSGLMAKPSSSKAGCGYASIMYYLCDKYSGKYIVSKSQNVIFVVRSRAIQRSKE